jgi:plastocyanin
VRPAVRVRAFTAMLAAGALAAGAVAGCFSERSAEAIVDGECRLPVGEDVAGSTLVIIRGFAFEPAEVRVRPGERVTWVSCDEVAHTSTSDGEAWASPLLAPGDAFTHTFDAAGDFPYHCEPHPFMTGRVTVE